MLVRTERYLALIDRFGPPLTFFLNAVQSERFWTSIENRNMKVENQLLSSKELDTDVVSSNSNSFQ